MIELGTIRVVDRQRVVNVYKDKQCVGNVTISISDPATETKILNLLQVLSDSKKDLNKP